MFYGAFKRATVNGKTMAVKTGKDLQNRPVSFVEAAVKPGQNLNVKVY
jgi:hypothetical protein